MPYAYRQSRSNPYARAKRPQRQTKQKFGKQYINPARFIKPARLVEEVAYIPTNTFDDFKMHELILENIKTKGFTHPSPIQDQSIPHGLEGKDILGIANTGTGKTLAFAIPFSIVGKESIISASMLPLCISALVLGVLILVVLM
jgi:ATP-dependent helicase YprA (DUF1998 family)